MGKWWEWGEEYNIVSEDNWQMVGGLAGDERIREERVINY